jgi:hypothetical protein
MYNYFYEIQIKNGVFDVQTCKITKQDKFVNPNTYFKTLYNQKPPKPTKTQGWWFDKMYLSSGTLENGFCVAWSK